MRFLGVDPIVSAVLAVLIINGAETHAVESVLLHPELHLVRHLGIGRVDQPVGLETFGVAFCTICNVGVIPALVGIKDHVFADKLVHASILDGVRLSQAELHRFRHNDMEHLSELLSKTTNSGCRLVITESVFSMDGDTAPLSELVSVASNHDALVMIDEAHATGIFGPGGSGLIRALELETKIDISMGTLSKALGGFGGFVACHEVVRNLLVNKARSFIYTTAPPPSALGSALGALQVLKSQPNLGSTLLEHASAFRDELKSSGLNTGSSVSQIIPVIVGDNRKALLISQKLSNQGIIAHAIRQPTVPDGSARLRLSVTLAHTPDILDRAAKTIAEVYYTVMP